MSEQIEIRQVLWETHRDQLLAVRHPVFVIEQNVPESIEVDESDPVSIHVLAVDKNKVPVGTARLLPEGKIGRVAVLKPWRKQGVGQQLMRHLIQLAIDRGDDRLSLHAQTWTIPFYETLGFVCEGDEFDEAGIPHRKMHLILH